MADITKCSGLKHEERGTITCPFRNRCERFTVPAGRAQSYFCETPLIWEPGALPSCEYGPDQARPSRRNESRDPQWFYYCAGSGRVIVRVDPGERIPQAGQWISASRIGRSALSFLGETGP